MSNALLPRLAALGHARRVHLFERLAHNLTISARIAWSSAELTTRQQLDAMKSINECLHRVTAGVWHERVKTSTWKDDEFLAMLEAYDEALPPAVTGTIEWAMMEALTRAETV